MKPRNGKYILNISLALLTLLIASSCENNFEPKADFVQSYSLYSVINGDTSFQVVTIKASTDLEGFVARHGENDPSVIGAKVTINHNGIDYDLSDSTLPNNDNYPYDNDIPFYYVNGLQPVAGDSLEIKAILPNGEVLKGKTKVPPNLRFHFTTTYGVLTNSLSNFYNAEWILDNTEVLFAPRLLLNYYVNENGIDVHHVKEVPIRFIQKEGELVPVFPIVTRRRKIRYEIDDFKRFLASISEGDTLKSNYHIGDAKLEVLVMNKDFATYYSSINTFDNGFTVQTQPPQFTNIKGGSGVFGFLIKPTLNVEIDRAIISEFGYRIYQK